MIYFVTFIWILCLIVIYLNYQLNKPTAEPAEQRANKMTKFQITNDEPRILDIRMVRSHGYGQYRIEVEFSAEGKSFKKSFHTTNSLLWDNDEKTKEDLLKAIGGMDALLEDI